MDDPHRKKSSEDTTDFWNNKDKVKEALQEIRRLDALEKTRKEERKEKLTEQAVEEACRNAIALVLKNSQERSTSTLPLTPDKVAAACKRALNAIAQNPAATTSKGVRRASEGKSLCTFGLYIYSCGPFYETNSISGEPLSAKRIQAAVREVLENLGTNTFSASSKAVKRSSGNTLKTPERKKPRTPPNKVVSGCKSDLRALKASFDRCEESDDDDGQLTPDEYGPDGRTKPGAVEARREREEALKNVSPNSSEDFVDVTKDLTYYKGNFILLQLQIVHLC